jgi:hypothetical protein
MTRRFFLTVPAFIVFAGCGGGSAAPKQTFDFTVAYRIGFTPTRARIYSRSLVVAEGSGSAGTGVYLITPTSSTPISYTDAEGNTYHAQRLLCASRNGWCVFQLSSGCLFYNALTKEQLRYPIAPNSVIGVVGAGWIVGAKWDGTRFAPTGTEPYFSLPSVLGVGNGDELVGSSATSSATVIAPTVWSASGRRQLSPLSSTQSAELYLYGGDGNYWGYSNRGDSRVATRWSASGTPTEVFALGAGSTVDLRDVNASGDVLGSPMFYRGVVKSTITAGENGKLAITGIPAEAQTIADDGSILAGGAVVVPS